MNTIDINECGKRLFCQDPCKVNEEQIDSIDLDVSENGIKVVINEDNIYTFSDTTDEEVNTVRKEEFAWLYDVFTEDISTHLFEDSGIEKTDLSKKRVLGWLI